MDNTDKMILDLIAKRKKKKKRNIIIIVSIFIALMIIGAFMPKEEKEQSKKSELSKYKTYEIEARLHAEDIVKTHAVNPEEAEFSNQKEEIRDNTYHCTGIITSKNDFGVKKQAKYLVKLLHKANNTANEWELVSETVFQ